MVDLLEPSALPVHHQRLINEMLSVCFLISRCYALRFGLPTSVLLDCFADPGNKFDEGNLSHGLHSI